MRIPTMTSLLSPSLSNHISDLRQRLTTTSQEAVTGRRSDIAQHLNGQVGKAMLSHQMVESISHQRDTLAVRGTRLDLAQASLTQIQMSTSSLGAQLQSALGADDSIGLELAGQDASIALQQVFSALNTRHGDRYLFAGDATSTPPLSSPETLMADIRAIAQTSPDESTFTTAMSTYFNDPAGPWQTTIYAGTPTSSDPDAVVAIDPAITRIVSGLATLSLAKSGENIGFLTPNSSSLQASASNLFSGETELTHVRATRGGIQAQIAQQQSALDVEETIVTAAFNELTGRDQYEAATELREIEASLEASYLLTSRLSNLSLLNYLR